MANDNKIMNKLDIGGQVKHVAQEDLEKNIDAFAQKYGNEKVYVTNSDGAVGSIPISQLKSALGQGYTLYDDTQGYLSREDIKEQSQPQQEQQKKEKVEKPSFDGYRGSIPQIAHSMLNEDTRKALDESMMTISKTPMIPGQSPLEYGEKVAAITDKIQKEEEAKREEYLRQMALPETTKQIDEKIAQVDEELRRYEEPQTTLTISGEMVPNYRTLFNPKRKELSADQIARKSELEDQRRALSMQRRFLDKIQEYENYDKGDYTKMGQFFRGISVNGDLQTFAALGLNEISQNQEFKRILDKAETITKLRESKRLQGDLSPIELKLTFDEQKALLLYNNMLDVASKDRGAYFNAGSGMYKTFEFMRDIALAGMGGGFTSLARVGLSTALKQVGKGLAKKALEVAVKTPLLPGFYTTLSENQINNYKVRNYGTQEKPQWYIGQKDSQGRILYKTWAQQASEYFTESMGSAFESVGLLSRIARSAGKAKGIIGKAARQYDRIHGTMLRNNVSRFVVNGLDKMGVNNFPMEFVEEIANVPLQSLMLWENQMQQLMDPRFYQEVAISTAAIGGVGSAVNIMASSATAAIERKRSNKAIADCNAVISQAIENSNDDGMKLAYKTLLDDISAKNFYDENGELDGSKLIDDLTAITPYVQNNPQLLSKTQELMMESLYREGQTEALKAIVEDEMGEIEYGTSGNVMFGADFNGTPLFILGETDLTYVVNDPATKQKRMIPKSDIVTIKTMPLDEMVTARFVNNQFKSAQLETIQDVEQAQQDAVKQADLASQPIQRGDQAMYNNERVVVEDIYSDASGTAMAVIMDSNDVPHNIPVADLVKADVVANQDRYMLPDGRRATIAATDAEGMIVMNILDDSNNVIGQETFQADELSTFEKLPADQANAIEGALSGKPQPQPAQPIDQTPAQQSQSVPRNEQGQVLWSSMPVEQALQLISSKFQSQDAVDYIAALVDAAQKEVSKTESLKPSSLDPDQREKELQDIKDQQSRAIAELEYLNNLSNLYQQQLQGLQKESEQISKLDEYRQRVAKWAAQGFNIEILESADQVKNARALAEIEDAQKQKAQGKNKYVSGWFEPESGKVYIYLPDVQSIKDIDYTVIHEVVAHKGLRALLGEQRYKEFCMVVWNSMSKQAQEYYIQYPGVDGDQAKAADEYIAYLAEKIDLTPEEQTVWDKIIETFRQFMESVMNTILDKQTVTNEDIATLIRMSYANLKKNSTPDVIYKDSSSGQAVFSIRTYREGGRAKLASFLEERVKDSALSDNEAKDILTQADDIYQMCENYMGVYEPFGAWSEAAVAVDDSGKPVFSVIKANGDYNMNLDFSLVCKKRRTLDAVFDEMIARGIISDYELGQLDIALINNIIRKYGFETACRLCFVDSRRFQVAAVADKFCALYNNLVRKTDAQLRDVIAKEVKDTVTKKAAKHLLDHPEDRVMLSRDNFMSANGFEGVSINRAAVMRLYNSAKGTGGPKASLGDVQYLNDIIGKNWTPEKAYAVGGVRLQSFSDYVPRMFFDYVQMLAELAAKQLPVHCYTKESIFVKQFGLTGIKINMSLVPRVDADGVAAGLDKDGNYAWQEGETFLYDEAIAIQNTPGYMENCGTIAVGVSDRHIRKMLSDENIRMVIPYHKSGLNKKVAAFNNIDKFTDYTKVQNTRYANGNALSDADKANHFDFNADLLANQDPRGAAQRYLDWCDDHNYLPKFDQFRDHPNYYKLLEDFTTIITKDGVDTIVPQLPVKMRFPSEGDAFGSIATLVQQGLEEDAILEGRRSQMLPAVVDDIQAALDEGKKQKKAAKKKRDEARFRVRTDAEKDALFNMAKEVFGTTNNFKVAGYMLPDGSLLDFSGKWEGGPADRRYTDHRAIGSGLFDAAETDDNYDTDMYDFIANGAIRLMPESAGIYVAQPLTEAQEDRLANFIYRNNGEVILEITNENGDSITYIEYNRRTSAEKVLSDIDNYFSKGIVPVQPEVRFRIKPLTEQQYQEYEAKLSEIHQGQEPKMKAPADIAQKRSSLYHDFLRKITNDPYAVVTIDDYIEIMEDYGVDQDDIDEVQRIISDGMIPVGHYLDGMMYFFANNITSIEQLRLTLVHERQHAITLANWDYYQDAILSREPDVEKLRANVDAISRSLGFPSDWDGVSLNSLIGEFISYAIEYAYTNNNIDSLAEYGLNNDLIEFIKQIDYEQQSNMDYSPARRGQNIRNAGEDGIQQDEGNPSSGSSEMGEEGRRSSQTSQTAAPVGGQIENSVYTTSDGKQISFRQIDITGHKLRELEDGEFSHVERIFTKSKAFDFTSGKKIESANDVAYIFSQLEDESIENSFAVLVKKGKPYVIHVGMGAFDYATFNIGAIVAADKLINADQVYMVHNHPSGNLYASNADMSMYKAFVDAFGSRAEDGIIINLRTGKYGTFNLSDRDIKYKADAPESEKSVKVYSFNKQVFEPGYDPSLLQSVGSSSDVASFISSHRLGDRAKLSALILDKRNKIVGNVFLSEATTSLPLKKIENLANEIADYALKMGGNSCIIYGSGVNTNDAKPIRLIADGVKAFSGRTISVVDMVHVEGNAQRYESAVDEGVSFRVVTDPALLAKLNSEPTMKVYRAMQIIDGKLYPPMSAYIDGKLREPSEIGVWEMAEENPDLADEKGYFKLQKTGKKKDSVPARYNPYFHTSATPLNDQFASAQDRPNLVTVEVEIPISELTSGYKAEKAKDAVGEVLWNAGVIQKKLTGKRKVYLSRYAKITRIVPDSEVADVIVKMFEGKNITMPSNVVTPSLRAELEERGIPFVETDNNGRRIKDNQVSFRYTEEMEQIKKQAEANDTFMKAPNGKPTKLTERQWLQVRTNAFKKWFGDWETWFKKNFLLNSNTVSSLSGNEFERVDGKTLTEQVAEYFESIGGKAMSPIYGEVILDEKGAEDSLSHGIGRNKAIAYAAVKDVIENGVLIDYDKNHKGRNYDSALIAAPIAIGGERYICEVVITRKQDNRFYLHEVTSVKRLQDAVSLTNSGQSPTAHQGVIAKVLQNIISASDNVSKVVDENGEPMVVYHGTGSEFWEFKYNDDSNELGAGYYFTDNEALANRYAQDIELEDNQSKLESLAFDIFIEMGHSENDFYDNEYVKDYNQAYDQAEKQLFKQSNVMPVFLNIKNPYLQEDINPHNARHFANRFSNDGIIDIAFEQRHPSFGKARQYVVFNANQIKSATDNTGEFSTENNDIRFRSIPVFQSNAEKATLAVKQDKATTLQWIAMLKKNGGLKAGEDKWIGLTDWLNKQDGTVTKQQVLDYIRENQIIVVDEFYSQDADIREGLDEMFGKEYEKAFMIDEDINIISFLNRKLAVELYNKVAADKYGPIDDAAKLSLDDWDKLNGFLIDIEEELQKRKKPINPTRAEYTTEGLEDNKEVALVVPTIESWDEFDEVHFGDAGEGRAVAWVRFGSTVDEDGNTVLVIDEVQSKRHQDAREKGYRVADVDKWLEDNNVKVSEFDRYYKFTKNGRTDKKWAKGLFHNDIEKAKRLYVAGYTKTDIPDAPFEKNWHELAMKRMLRYAAENGFDKIAWTTGEQQAERYDLSKTLDEIAYYKSGNKYVIIAGNKDDSAMIYDQYFTAEELAQTFGKEIANKIINNEGVDESILGYDDDSLRYIHGENMKVGGDGMKAFYDKMLVGFMNKYGKKWGVIVQDVNLPELGDDGLTMHSVDVTEAMKESVLNEPQVMFRIAVTPEEFSSKGFVGVLGQQGFDNMLRSIFEDLPLLEKAAYIKRGQTPAQVVADLVDDIINTDKVDQMDIQQVLMAVKDALAQNGPIVMPDTDELLYQLWKDTHPRPALTIKEKLQNKSEDSQIRFRAKKENKPATNVVKLSRAMLWQERLVDRMISVTQFYKELKGIGISISDDMDPYVTENLAMSRSQTEDARFKDQIYEPMIAKVIEIEQLFIKLGLATDMADAYKQVSDYLYARHAPERNKQICVEEVTNKMLKDLSKEERALFKDTDIRRALMALVSRMYNERANSSTPKTAELFGKNMLKANGQDKAQQLLLQSLVIKFAGMVDKAFEDIDSIFKSNKGTNRSGMTDADARVIVNRLYTSATSALLDELSEHVRKATRFTIDTWQKYSLINDKTASDLKSMYKYYIPLRSWEEKEDVDYEKLASQAFNRASEIINLNRKAGGRTSRADDPLAYIASLAQSAIVVGNKNMIRLNLFRLIKANESNPQLQEFATLPKVYYVEVPGSDDVTAYTERPAQELFDQGLVQTKTNKEYRWHKSHSEYDAHIVPVIINGTRQMIELRGELGIQVASAINNTNVVHWQAANALKPFTNWLSAIRTSYNPEFVLTNFIRDFMFANLVYPVEGGSDKQLLTNLGHAFKAIHRLSSGKSVNSQWDAYYEEFLTEGGQTGFFAMRNIDQMKKEIEKLHKRLHGSKVNRHNIAKTAKAIAEYTNNLSESAMRLAVYITEREKGTSKKQAAYKAHEISVNFNRKGTWSSNFGAFYSFFNASVQGTARLFSWMNRHKKGAAKALSAIAMIKLVTNLIAAAVGGDDYDELSDYTKFSNILIPIGVNDNDRMQFFCLPMAQGIRAVTNIADNTVDVLRGKKTIGQALHTQYLNMMGEFLPLSFDAIDLTSRNSSYSFAVPFLPTAVQPLMDIWTNTDFKGDPIRKESFIQSQQGFMPEFQNVYGGTSRILVGTFKYLNRLGGGTDYRSSAVKVDKEGDVSKRSYGYMFDWNPANVEHFLNAYLGAFVTLPSKLYDTAYSLLDPQEEVEAKDLIVVNRFIKTPYKKDGYEIYYQVKEHVEMTKNSISAAKKADDRKGAAIIKKRNAKLLKTFEVYDERVKQLSNIIKNDDISQQRRQKLEQQRDDIVNKAALEFQKIMKDEEDSRH